MTTATAFDDLASDDLFGDHPVSPAAAPVAEEFRPTFEEPCKKCGGRGMYRSYAGYNLGACFACKGKGFLIRLTSPESRAKARVAAAKRVERTQTDNWAAFEAAHPAVAAWMVSSTGFEFADSLKNAVIKYGSLSERQLAAAENCVAKRAAAKAAAEERKAAAPEISIAKIEEAIATAKANGLKRPILRLATFKFSPAPESGKNAGAIYVKTAEGEGQYLGKIMGGKLFAVRECTDEQRDTILTVAADPKAAAIAYGKKYGQCCICARELSDPVSVENGIGPICQAKYGW